MDTKSKKYKPSKVWAKFFIGVSIIVILISIITLGLNDLEDAKILSRMLFSFDLKDTKGFKEAMAIKFDTLVQHITEDIVPDERFKEEGLDNRGRVFLANEGENLIYYAKDLETGKILTNSKEDISIAEDGSIIMPEGYSYYLFSDNGKFTAQKDNIPLDIYKMKSGYDEVFGNYMYGNEVVLYETQILLIVKDNIVENPYGNSILHMLKMQSSTLKKIALVGLVILCVGIGLLIYTFNRREHKREHDTRIAKVISRISLEIKLLIALLMIIVFFTAGQNRFLLWNHNGYLENILYAIILAFIYFWWIYFVLLDIRVNREKVFSKNVVNWAIRKYKEFESRQPFQRGLLIKDYLTFGIATIVSFAVGIFLYAWGESIFSPVIVVLGIMVPPILITCIHFIKYKRSVDDIGETMVHVERMQTGDMSEALSLRSHSDLYILGENLNEVQLGLNRAIENSLKSEKMKVELITNISHDLKTPLTSITSYADLLSKEDGLPEHVEDYIDILKKKAHRLNILIEDLFDLSKAVSGEMAFKQEAIDLGKLIEQTLGDMEERIKEANLQFRVNIPDSPVNIISDGKKLYRVLVNLIANTLKYTLEGTRVYIDLVLEEGLAFVIIKNIANYEMDFGKDEIMERFVRGDKARSSEGAGLGLAIAQNFTLSCGGDFDMQIDGDLFKVILSFKVH
ncbi:MAG: hypothetical protein GX974_06085 [Clostridiales bacterium]|nr:hypothetical protein [Clostridiales bacterium]